MIQLFNYEGNNITFRGENDEVFVNATEMAKPFRKQPIFWLKNQNTQEFLTALSKLRILSLTDLVIVSRGGNDSGTWFHEDVALEFARWLSPAFAIWCNDRIKEIIKFGFSATPEKLEELVVNPEMVIELASALKKVREEKAMLEKKLNENPIRFLSNHLQKKENTLSAKAVALYSLLTELSRDKKYFECSDVYASKKLKISRKTIRVAREELQNAKLLDFSKDIGMPIKYHLNSF
ncbi:KilA-N domain-containing protein [Ornithobacterium rhinotracheale]